MKAQFMHDCMVKNYKLQLFGCMLLGVQCGTGIVRRLNAIKNAEPVIYLSTGWQDIIFA